MDKNKLITKINSAIEYDADQSELGFTPLTKVRYSNKTVSEAFFLSDNKIYKLHCEEVSEKDLPEKELNHLQEIRNELNP